MASSEFQRISRLKAIFGEAPPGVTFGIGDDAAVLTLSRVCSETESIVWTIDSSVEGIHFRRDLVGWEDIGWRSMMAAASDLAAMAARPLGALSALMLTTDLGEEEIDALARGQNEAARTLGTAVVGGNLSRGGEVSLTTTLVGCAARPAYRSGAQPGDWLVLVGDVGLAAAGLHILLRIGGSWRADDADEAVAVEAWRRPVARLDDGLRYGALASAQIDVSDGVAQDAGHVAEASGIRIEISADEVVSPRLRSLAARYEFDPLELALGGGEDYAILATMLPERVPHGAKVIGRCEEGMGVWIRRGDTCERVEELGYDHFRRGGSR